MVSSASSSLLSFFCCYCWPTVFYKLYCINILWLSFFRSHSLFTFFCSISLMRPYLSAPHDTVCLVFIAFSLHDSRFHSFFFVYSFLLHFFLFTLNVIACVFLCVFESLSSLSLSVCLYQSYSSSHISFCALSLIPWGISKQMNSNRCEEMYQNTIYFGWFARLVSKQMENGNQNDMQ